MNWHASPDYVARHDRERTYPYELYDAWFEAGLFGFPFREEHDGLFVERARDAAQSLARKAP
jgi:hypothetical protein